MAKYNIGGVIFNDEASAKRAAKELKAVEYILGQLKEADEHGVLKVYNKLLDQRMFSTVIGIGFLEQLRKNLLDSGAFAETDIRPVYNPGTDDILPEDEGPVTDSGETAEPSADITVNTEPDDSSSKKDVKAKLHKSSRRFKTKSDSKSKDAVDDPQREIKKLRTINRILLVACITLALCVIGMFYISTTINSPTILNYEQEILNKYSSWEQELTEREQAVREKEVNQQ